MFYYRQFSTCNSQYIYAFPKDNNKHKEKKRRYALIMYFSLQDCFPFENYLIGDCSAGSIVFRTNINNVAKKIENSFVPESMLQKN